MSRKLSPAELAELERSVGLRPPLDPRDRPPFSHPQLETPQVAPLRERLTFLAVGVAAFCFVTGMVGVALTPRGHGDRIAHLTTASVILVSAGWGPLALAATGLAAYWLARFVRWVVTGR